MSCKKILRNSYIPTKPRFFNEHDKGDLDIRLKQMTYNEILQNPEEHFEKCKIITFDLIHNECRGDELNHSREFYETLHKKKLDIEIENKYKNSFDSFTILCEGKELVSINSCFYCICFILYLNASLNIEYIRIFSCFHCKVYSADLRE